MELHILNGFLLFCLKPTLVLWGVLMFSRWTPARSPYVCHWYLVSLGVLACIFIPFSAVLPKIYLACVPEFVIDEMHYYFHAPWRGSLPVFYVFIMSIAAVYFFVATLLTISHCWHWLSAKAIVGRAKSVTGTKPALINKLYTFKESEELQSPVVWGAIKPVIVLPKGWSSWSEGRFLRIITHELAHIQRRDWLTKNILFVFRAWLWFIPPVWTLTRRAMNYAEYACDDAVIEKHNDRAAYARDLLDMSQYESSNKCFVAINGSELSIRVNLILDGARDRSAPDKWLKVGVVSTALIILLPVFMLSLNALPRVDTAPSKFYLDIQNHSQEPEGSVGEQIDVNDLMGFRELISERPVEEIMHLVSQRASRLNVNEEKFSLKSNKKVPLLSLKETSFIATPEISVIGALPYNLVSPVYPEKLLNNGVEGEVRVRFDISLKGKAINVVFLNDSNRHFQREVMRSLVKSRFESVHINGKAVVLTGVTQKYIFTVEHL